MPRHKIIEIFRKAIMEARAAYWLATFFFFSVFLKSEKDFVCTSYLSGLRLTIEVVQEIKKVKK